MKNCIIHSEKLSKADDLSDWDTIERIISIEVYGDRRFFVYRRSEDVTGAHECVISESLTPSTDGVGQLFLREETVDDDTFDVLRSNPGMKIFRQHVPNLGSCEEDDLTWKVQGK